MTTTTYWNRAKKIYFKYTFTLIWVTGIIEEEIKNIEPYWYEYERSELSKLIAENNIDIAYKNKGGKEEQTNNESRNSFILYCLKNLGSAYDYDENDESKKNKTTSKI